jgi:hypothetical protein
VREKEMIMMYIWHEWREHKNLLKSLEAERKAANKCIWKNLNNELKAARQAKDWAKANNLKMHISNYKYDKRGSWGLSMKFDGRHGFSRWDY